MFVVRYASEKGSQIERIGVRLVGWTLFKILTDHEVMLLWLTNNMMSNCNPDYNSRSSTTSSTHSNSLIMPKFTSHAMLR